jgi:hypothetical protein
MLRARPSALQGWNFWCEIQVFSRMLFRRDVPLPCYHLEGSMKIFLQERPLKVRPEWDSKSTFTLSPEPIGPKRRLSKIRVRAWTIIVLLVLVFLGWATGYVPLLFNRPIYIAGTVVDEEGNLLKDVTVKVTESTFVLTNASGTRVKRSRMTVNGSFRIVCFSCKSLGLWFSKKGYYDERLDAAGQTGKFLEIVVRKNIPMVLEETGPLPYLERYRGILRFSTRGIETVVPIHSGFGTRGVTLEWLTEQLEKRIRSKTPEPLHISLQAKVGEDGELVTEWQAPPGRHVTNPGRSGVSVEYPRDVVLDFSTAKGGVVLYEPPEKLLRLKRRSTIFRSMRTAPVEGYRTRVMLSPAHKGGYYFYCRVNKRYGKGWITTPQLLGWKNRRTVYANIQMRINPDGSRNVASVD